MDFPLPVCLGIGLFQCLALIPGTSRSGATIVGALLLGADKRSAAEFSFFLAMPTMAGAFAFDLFKNRDMLSAADLPVIAIGFIAAFVVALIVVRYLLDYVSRHGFALFAWWRLIVGVRRPRRAVRLGLVQPARPALRHSKVERKDGDADLEPAAEAFLGQAVEQPRAVDGAEKARTRSSPRSAAASPRRQSRRARTPRSSAHAVPSWRRHGSPPAPCGRWPGSAPG